MRAAALAGLKAGDPPGQLIAAGWIEKWGAASIYARPLTIQEAARFTSLMDVYRRFSDYHAGLLAAVKHGKSAGVVLFDMCEAGTIPAQDYDFIRGLMESGEYKPKG